MNELQKLESNNPLISIKEVQQLNERIFKIVIADALKSGYVLSGFPLPDEDNLRIVMNEFIKDIEGAYWLPLKAVKSAIKKGVSGEYGEDRTRISAKNWRYWIAQEREIFKHKLSKSDIYLQKKVQFLDESRKVFFQFKRLFEKEMNNKILNLNGSNLDLSERQKIYRHFKNRTRQEFWSEYKLKVDEIAVLYGIMNDDVEVVKSGQVYNEIFGIK